MPTETTAHAAAVRAITALGAVCALGMAIPLHPTLGLTPLQTVAVTLSYAGCAWLSDRAQRAVGILLSFTVGAHGLLFVMGAGHDSIVFAPVLVSALFVSAVLDRPRTMWTVALVQLVVHGVVLVLLQGWQDALVPLMGTSLWFLVAGLALRQLLDQPVAEVTDPVTVAPTLIKPQQVHVPVSLPPQETRLAPMSLMESATMQRSARAFHHLMGTILASAQLVKDTCQDAGQASEDLDFLVRKANEASDMALRLLTVARNDATDSGSIDLDALLHGLVPDLEAILGPYAQLEVQVLPGLPAVHMDASNLTEVLFEVARNAAEAMGPAGHLRIAAFIDGNVPAGCIRLVVEDNGPGFSKRAARHAFEPFFSTRNRGHSAGLGLPLVQSTVRRSGGRAQVDPNFADGGRLLLDLPAVPAADGVGMGGGVVVVGREEGDSSVVASLLRDSGYTVRFAIDATQALQALSVVEGSAELVVLEASDDNLRLANLIARDWTHLDVVWLGRGDPELSPSITVLHNVPVYAVVDALKRITKAA